MPGSTSTSGIGKFERLDDDRFERRRVELAARERAQHAQRRSRSACGAAAARSRRRPRLDRFGDVQAAVGREPVEQRGA